MRLGLRKPREFALAPLSEAESARLTGPSTRLHIGVQRAFAPHAFASGVWETTQEGTRLWRMALRSPGAHGIRVEFDNFDVGDGKVWLHDNTHVAGPYTGRGIYGDGHFYTSSVYAESAVLEYEPAAGVTDELEPPFQIRSVVHQVQSALDATAGKADPADACELDANCFPEWSSSLSVVGQISFVGDGVEALCSGSLLATRDNSAKPYFLTAGHCVHDEATARTVQAYWNYQTPSCGGKPPASRDAALKSTLGAHLISAAPVEDGDFSVILLNDVPNGVTFSGWDPGNPGMGDFTAIHHPSGSWKRLSFGFRFADQDVEIVDLGLAPAQKFYRIAFTEGRIERGSSGSPLFSSPGVIVASASYAQIFSDGTVCRINPQGTGYSRFSVTYDAVKDYLENLPADNVLPGKSTLAFTVNNHVSSAPQIATLTTQAANPIGFKLRADAPWIQLSAITGTVSGRTPATVAISADATKLPQAGQYTSTVTILSAAAPPQFITVTVNVTLSQSAVVASITPNPATQNGGQWSFQINLAETGGAATHVTGVKFNGSDYTPNLKTWFGTTAINANATITAPLSGAGRFPAGDQYFEFWGVDDASGQPWYRTAVVTFR